MKNIFYRKLVSLCLIVSLMAILSPIQIAQAAALTSMSDTMSRVEESISSDHTILYTTPTGMSSGTIVIDFNTAGFVDGSATSTDVDLSYGLTTGAENQQTLAYGAGAATWGAVFAANELTLTYPTSGGTEITAGWKVKIEIGTVATNGGAGVNQLTNPAAGDDKIIAITSGADSGSLAVSIIADDQIAVSANVDETLSFSLSSNSAGLGTMTTGAIASASAVTLTMSTNASGGYAVTVQDEGDASNPGLYKSTAPTKLIASAAVTLVAGTEGYGIQAAAVTGSPTIDAAYLKTGDDVGGLLRTAATMVSKSEAVDGNTATVTVKAAINATTPAGDYADTLTLICTGTF